MKHLLFTLLGCALLGLSACDQGNAVLVVPDTYSFENVNYQEQLEQMAMLEALSAYAKTANVPSAAELSITKMYNMLQNTSSPFDNHVLNGSAVSINAKLTAANSDLYMNTMAQLRDLSKYTNRVANPGVKGIATSLDGTKTYL